MKNNQLYFFVFLEGCITLAMQILSGVIITPYWGGTFLFWSLQLFFVMLGLSAGYYLVPSWLLKRNKDVLSNIWKILLFSFLYLLGLMLVADKLLMSLIATIETPVTGIVITLLFFIFIPMALLGALPVLVTQTVSSSKEEGAATGKTFYLSSLSGIAAVVVFTYIALPWFGLNYSEAIVLLLAGSATLFLAFRIHKKSIGYVVAGLSVLGFFILATTEKKLRPGTVMRTIEIQNGILGQLKVVENRAEQTKCLYVNNALQSKAHLTGRSLFPYVYSVVMYSTCRPPGSQVLLAGMGAGSLVYEFNRLGYPVDVVDIDDRLPGIVSRNFLNSDQKLNFIHSDIRRYVKKNTKLYDIMVFDLSKGESVPTNVYTLECFRECKKSLAPNGILLIHFLSSLNEKGMLALTSLKRTLIDAGFEAQLLNSMNKRNIGEIASDPNKPEGFLFIASNKIDLSKTNFMIDSSIIKELIPDKEHLFLSLNEKEGSVLTDDRPILDELQSDNAFAMRKISIRSLVEQQKHEK
jgi:predicted membrane-bound spermidine synthase